MDDDIVFKLMATAPIPTGPSVYVEEFRDETRVLPGLCGLPRVIRAFPPRKEARHA